MENSVKERLKAFVNYLNISEREFCRSVGVGSAYIASIKRSIKADKLEAITKQYPELNPTWLIRGEGSMLLTDSAEKEPERELTPSEILAKLLEHATTEKARLLSIVEGMQQTIKVQQGTIESLWKTIDNQQQTIDRLMEINKKANAQTVEPAGCANAV